MTRLTAFERFGIEIEYMIVHRDTLEVAPIADRLLTRAAGELTNETVQGTLAWSNELVLHVVELKTNGPTADLVAAASAFQRDVRRINELLETDGAALMPGAAHPWMNPAKDTRLWPHGDDAIYAAYDRIFGCRGHGWSNLQSVHINLPFAGDAEFARLHSAIRAVLPLLPALAASSPFLDGRATGVLDTRLREYAKNQARLPIIAGDVVPEPVKTEHEYRDRILAPIYAAIEPFDPEGTLRHEWLNSRGAIARFDRNTIEIRLLDVQEHPGADLAVAALVIAVVRALYDDDERLCAADALPTESLTALLRDCVRDGERALVGDPRYAALFGLEGTATAGAVWAALTSVHRDNLGVDPSPLDLIVGSGSLATRLVRAAEDPATLPDVYRRLVACLADGRSFLG